MFESILNAVIGMSMSGAVLIITVVLIRFAGRRIFSKSMIFLLWLIVLAKLLVPVSIPLPTSIYNIIPDFESTEVNVGGVSGDGAVEKLPEIADAVHENLDANDSPHNVPKPEQSISNGVKPNSDQVKPIPESPKFTLRGILGIVYVTVTSVLLVLLIMGYAVNYIRLRKAETVTDCRVREIAESSRAGKRVRHVKLNGRGDAMLFGIFAPRVVLPADYEKLSEKQLTYVLKHEYAHIERLDNLTNLLMLLALCVHWFNPAVWLGYALFTKDMEYACDEMVLSRLDEAAKREFAETIVFFAERGNYRPYLASVTLGKADIKERLVRIMKFKRSTVLVTLLSVLTVIAVVLIFATGEFSNSPDNLKEQLEDEFSSEAETIDQYVKGLADDADFNGKTFVLLGDGVRDVHDENMTEDDTVYKRQKEIEEKFGVTIETVLPDTEENILDDSLIIGMVKQDVLSGSDEYNAVEGVVAVSSQLQNLGLLEDINSLEKSIPLENDWWMPDIAETYGIGGKLYLLKGDIVSDYYNDAYVIAYNKSLAEEYGISVDELHKAVKNGTWTFDMMLSLGEKIPADNEEIYSFAAPNALSVITAHGVPITHYDEDGIPYYPETCPDELASVYEKFSSVFSDENVSLYGKVQMVTPEEIENIVTVFEKFKSGKALFCFVRTCECVSLIESDTSFGILPIPKADKDSEYVTYGNTWDSSDVMLPKGNTNGEFTATILEAMAALGRKYFRPAAFEAWMAEEEPDLESVRSIKIAFETKKYDAVHQLTGSFGCYCDADMGSALNRIMLDPEAEIKSAYFLEAKMANSHLEKLIMKLSMIDNK